MPNFNIVRKNKADNTFRVAKIMSDFDVQLHTVEEVFQGEIIYPDDWKIGLIVGGSGTGKTTIARELFQSDFEEDFEYKHNSVVDDLEGKSLEEIQRMFYTVGFGSVPSWLKPYRVLSNGEKMRVDLARKFLKNDFVVFDEFTSVVDRQVAKTMCVAIKKMMEKTKEKQFVAISCHFDIVEYLQPDWVFNTDTMTQVFQSAHDLKCNLMSEDVKSASGQNLGSIII